LNWPGPHAAHVAASGVKPALHTQASAATLAAAESECGVQAWQSLGPLLTVGLYVPAPHAVQVA
jgi:histidinol dehydrogenase